MKILISFSFSLIYIWTLILPLLNCLPAPIVHIPDGRILGTRNYTVGKNKTYYAYRGIPYAEPPIGPLRFAPPIPNKKWKGILKATEDKSDCTQFNSMVDFGNESDIVGSEDCLYVNVYTTSKNTSTLLPVMAWIFGGAFESGTAGYKLYGPDYLLEKDVLFVSFNYRVGVFGFLSTEDLAAPGNFGLKDQILALKWIKRNIKYFGGDPDRITVSGFSAGGSSVSYILQSKETKGLYRAAIMESGTSLFQWALTLNARKKTFDLAKSLGINENDSRKLIAKLRQVPYKKLKLAENVASIETLLDGGLLHGFQMGVVQEPEHPGSVVTEKSYKLLKNGEFNKVPVLIGINSLEAMLVYYISDAIAPYLGGYNMKSTSVLVPTDLTDNKTAAAIVAELVRDHYFGPNGNITINTEPFAKFASADQCERPTIETVKLMSKYTNVYLYVFAYMGNFSNSERVFNGVGHAEDMLHIFYNTDTEVYPRNLTASPADALARERLVTLYTNFVKNLNPNPLDSNITWLPNTPSTDISKMNSVKYLNINSTIELKEDPFNEDWQFYQKIFDTYGDSDYSTY